MTTSAPQARPLAEASTPTALVPLNLIRTDTVLARFPIHNLAKKGEVHIHITVTNAQGHVDCSWQVFPNPAFGAPRQLAYKLDTLVINKKLDALGRPLPKLIRLGSAREIGHQLGFSIGQAVKDLRKAAHQNAGTYIIAKLHYTATDGTTRTLEAGFTRYSIIFTGERRPDGTKADAIYLLLNEPYWEVLNSAPTRPLDYDYLQALPPTAQRCYELISAKLFTALKYGHPYAKLLYSEYCTFAAQQRYTDYDRVKKQMYKVHKPHLTSGYLARVRYEAAHDGDDYALEVVRDTAKFLGAGVASIINIFNPQVVVICGGVTLAGDKLFVPLRSEVNRRAFKPAVEVCRILPGELPGTAGVWGATAVFIKRTWGRV